MEDLFSKASQNFNDANKKLKVLNKHRDNCSNAIYIGRPSKFGNPFEIGKDGNREDVVRKHKEWFLNNKCLMDLAKKELKGKDLYCFCSPLRCHGDILLEVANGSIC